MVEAGETAQVAGGDLHYIDDHWYVSHAGLFRIARQNRCAGIRVQPVDRFCERAVGRWAFEAIVYKSKTCRGLVGYGGANPSSVPPLVRGAEMRMAEARAVNRALRKAYGIGICSVDEIGRLTAGTDFHRQRPQQRKRDDQSPRPVVRAHPPQQLDATQVKQYDADFCSTETLRGRS